MHPTNIGSHLMTHKSQSLYFLFFNYISLKYKKNHSQILSKLILNNVDSSISDITSFIYVCEMHRSLCLQSM